MHCPILLLRLGCETEARLGSLQLPRHELRRIAPDLRPMLEPMAASRTDQQHVVRRGMPVDQQIAVGAVFVLTNALFIERRSGQRGKSLGKIGTRFGQRARRSETIATIGIDRRAMLVVRYLEAAALEVRKVYRVISDHLAEGRGLVRVIDESGEDYLYPAGFFLPLELPRAAIKVLSKKSA